MKAGRFSLAMIATLVVAAGCSRPPAPAAGEARTDAAAPVDKAPSAVADALRARHQMFRGFIEEAAQRMPAERYDFRPVPEIMSYGDLVNHIAAVQIGFCAEALGDQAVDAIDLSRTDKASALALLSRSFAYCEPAYAALTDENASDLVSGSGRDPKARIRPLLANISHNSLEYGKLTIHLRLNGIVPPSSAAADRP